VAPSWSLDVGSHTEVGHVRDHNEDALRVDQDIQLFSVADGMGGHNAGERASILAIEELFDFVAYRSDPASAVETMRAAFRTANEAIFRESLEYADRRGMGTTMTAVWLSEPTYWIGHVGDSRAWLIRDGVCRQLTDDHSVMGEQLRQGLITPEQALTHPLRNVLTRSLGSMPSVEVDVLQGEAAIGDTFVIGSDGMTRALDEAKIAQRVATTANAQDAAADLVRYACEEDGTDNVSVVVVRCCEDS
jgi:protein phosphatase